MRCQVRTVDGAPVVGLGMTATTYFTSANQAARHARGAPRIAGTAVAFTPHRHNQDEVARELTEFARPGGFTCVAKGTSDWVDAVADHANSHEPFALRAAGE